MWVGGTIKLGIVIDKTLIVNDDTFKMMTRTSRCVHQRAWEEDEGSGMINDSVPLGHLSIPFLTSSSPHPSCMSSVGSVSSVHLVSKSEFMGFESLNKQLHEG